MAKRKRKNKLYKYVCYRPIIRFKLKNEIVVKLGQDLKDIYAVTH